MIHLDLGCEKHYYGSKKYRVETPYHPAIIRGGCSKMPTLRKIGLFFLVDSKIST